MPPQTGWPEVVDNFIKIGLPTLLAGFFGWLVALHNAKSAISKMHYENRIKLLSEVRVATAAYFSAFVSLINTGFGMITAFSQVLETDKNAAAFWPQYFTKFTNEKAELTKLGKEMFDAQALLLVLGEPDAESLLKNWMDVMGKCVIEIKVDTHSASVGSRFSELQQAANEVRISFYRELGKGFQRSV